MLLFGNKPQSILEPPKGVKRSIVVILLLWAVGCVIMCLDSLWLQIVGFKNNRRNNKHQ
jgi:hypothetical protein